MKINCLQHVLREGDSTMDFISKMAASKMGQLKAEIAELKERLEETHTDEQRARLKKTIREKETYYNILADRIRMHSIF